MTYGTIKVDTVTFTDAGIDKSVTLSGLVQNPTFSGNVTVTGTISGVTVTGTTASFTSGVFTSISGGTHTITSGVFAAGSAASPSISFTSDPDTGLYSPGANQVAISTNGTGRLFVDATGKVTVNQATDGVPSINIESDNDGRSRTILRFTDTDVATAVNQPLGVIQFFGSDTSGAGAGIKSTIGAYSESANGDSYLTFSTATSALNNQERLRITSAGLVGIGTSSPQSLFECNDSANDIQARFGTLSAARNPIIRLQGRNTANTQNCFADIKLDSENQLLILSDPGTTSGSVGANPVVIDSSGRLLVGTSTSLDLNAPIQAASTTFGVEFFRFSTSATGTGGAIDLARSNSGTVGTTAAIVSGQGLGIVRFRGAADGSTYLTGAQIEATSDGGTVSATSMPTRLVFSTTADGASSPTERLRITSAGLVGIGTGSPAKNLHISSSGNTALRIADTGTAPTTFGQTNGGIELVGGNANTSAKYMPGIKFGSTDSAFTTTTPKFGAAITAEASEAYDADTDGGMSLAFWTTPNDPGTGGSLQQRLTILNSGLVGIGTSSPGALFSLAGSSAYTVGNSGLATQGLDINATAGGSGLFGGALSFGVGGTGRASISAFQGTTDSDVVGLAFNIHNSGTAAADAVEAMRIDSSGRLLVGTSTNAPSDTLFVVHGQPGNANEPAVAQLRRGGTILADYTLGQVSFADESGNIAAHIRGAAEAGWGGTGDAPGRLVFSTTADGASSPTERMRIGNNGYIYLNTTNVSPPENNVTGVTFQGGGDAGTVGFNRDGFAALLVGRKTDDGDLVRFYQDGTQEGSISVSGTTVSYNGAHLSRWSQLPSGAERNEILRGSVLSNIDEMCEWGEEDNEQLNRMKVSDVEGDKNVAGVFQAWDDDDDTYANDFYCAMTGDFVIRIAAGVTVERGDLLMSAGDGTAKPQDDDIIRSKTIAKVTSTTVSCTYEDGSYCVPCVLMAC